MSSAHDDRYDARASATSAPMLPETTSRAIARDHERRARPTGRLQRGPRAGEQGVQDVHRRRVRALRERGTHQVQRQRRGGQRRPRRGQRAARVAQGRARRRARGEERARWLGWAHRVQPRADPLSPRRDDGVASRGASRPAHLVRGEAMPGTRTRARRARSSRSPVDRSRRLLRGLLRRRFPVAPRGRSNPVSGPHFGFSVPDAMGVVALVAPAAAAALLGLAVDGTSGHRGRQHGCVVVASSEKTRAACDRLVRVPRHERDLPGGVVNVLTGQASGDGAAPREAPRGHRHGRLERRTLTSARRRRARGQREREARRDDARRGGDGGALRRPPVRGSATSERFLETKTRCGTHGV